jgi:putative acetyltransferase
MALEIRQLTIDDTAAAAMVMRRSFEERLPKLEVLHTPEEDAGFVRDHLFPTSEMWGAFDPELVGFIAFANEWIEQFYILPTWQGRGIGNALLAIPMTKFSTLKLWTFQQNSGARQFYERKGFVPIELTDGQANEHKEPDILYQWVRGKHAG